MVLCWSLNQVQSVYFHTFLGRCSPALHKLWLQYIPALFRGSKEGAASVQPECSAQFIQLWYGQQLSSISIKSYSLRYPLHLLWTTSKVYPTNSHDIQSCWRCGLFPVQIASTDFESQSRGSSWVNNNKAWSNFNDPVSGTWFRHPCQWPSSQGH